MRWNYVAAGGSLASLVSMALAIFSTEWALHTQLIVCAISSLSILSVLTVYFLQGRPQELHGPFEWQWAGENWKGVVDIHKNREGQPVARVDVRRVVKRVNRDETTHTDTTERVLWTTEEGRVYGNRRGFTLEMSVKKRYFDAQDNGIHVADQRVVANLSPVEAYAGIARYTVNEHNEQEDLYGDIVLVRYNSGVR